MKKILYRSDTEKTLCLDKSIVSPWAKRVVPISILVLPFFILYWLVPFVGRRSIGGDYLSYWIQQQLYLQFCIRSGTFPLYAPGFAGGWTAGVMTLGQLWHPISWVAARLPGYWSGHAIQICTLLRLLSLGGTHLVLFLFLRRLRLTTTLALVISFITVYNLRMLDMFRYAASLENYVAYLLLCVALAWHYITPTKRLGPLAIAVLTWLLVVGGHPQFMYLGLLGAALICLIIPFYMARMLPDEVPVQRRRLWTFYLSVGLSVTAGIVLASSYILPYLFEYIPESYRSYGMGFNWACEHQDTLSGSLYNLFNPLHSNVHGAFGGSALILLAMLTPLLFLFRCRVPLSVLYLWLVYLVTFVLMLGSNGPLYYYFWKYFPLAQSFRVPGRLAMVLPFVILFILAWMARVEPIRFRIRSKDVCFSPIILLAIVALVLLVIVNSFPPSVFEFQGGYARYSPAKMHNIPAMVTVLTITCGLASLAALVLLNTLRHFRTAAAVILVAAVFVQVTATLRYGTWVVSGQKRVPTYKKMRTEQLKRLAYQGYEGDWSKIVLEHQRRTFVEPTLARVCRKYTVFGSRKEVYERMARERSIDHIFVENYPAAELKTGTSALDSMGIDSVKLKYNSFNNQKFDVMCVQPAFFVFSYPYSKRWQAYVNGQRAPVYRANGIEHAILLPAGNSEVEFRYWSWPALAGTAISCLVLLSMTLSVLVTLRPGLFRRLVMIGVSCLCVIAFLMWYRSLYWGGNIGTNYTWTSEAIVPHFSSHYNRAYGKFTVMSQKSALWYYSKVSSFGVDGERRPDSGFCTSIEEHAWWQVDLAQAEPIGEIVLYEPTGEDRECSFPFDIIVSTDGKRWRLIGTLMRKSDGDRWRLRFQNVMARYIRLQTRHRGRLALAEVEVYGPGDGSDSTALLMR